MHQSTSASRSVQTSPTPFYVYVVCWCVRRTSGPAAYLFVCSVSQSVLRSSTQSACLQVITVAEFQLTLSRQKNFEPRIDSLAD